MKRVIWRELDGGCLFTRLPVRFELSTTPDLQMPMGKYRGASIRQVVERDAAYVGWLIGQDWFFEKYPNESECLVECISINPNVGPSVA